MRKFFILLIILTTSSFAVYHPALKEKMVSYDDLLVDKMEAMETNLPDTRVWLLVIGIEKYDVTDDIIYSGNSARLFSQVAVKRFGVTPRRKYLLVGNDATSAKIKDSISILANNVQKGDTIVFYYSGHGIPSFPAKDPYILPKDKDPEFVSADSDLKLSNIYKKLQDSPADKVIVFVDACFSGATDNKSLFKGVAATRIKAKKLVVDSAKIAVVTAGKDKQFSNKYSQKHHRLFSYFVIDELIDGAKDVNTLFSNVRKNVDNVSFEFGDSFRQTPTISGNENIAF